MVAPIQPTNIGAFTPVESFQDYIEAFDRKLERSRIEGATQALNKMIYDLAGLRREPDGSAYAEGWDECWYAMQAKLTRIKQAMEGEQ